PPGPGAARPEEPPLLLARPPRGDPPVMSPTDAAGGRVGERPTVVVLGATSAIARAVAGAFARRGFDLLLAGRDREELDRVALDLSLRYGVSAQGRVFDALAFDSHPAFVEA